MQEDFIKLQILERESRALPQTDGTDPQNKTFSPKPAGIKTQTYQLPVLN